MIIAQVKHGRVSAAYLTDPRELGFASALPPGIELCDASDFPDVTAGWYATPLDAETWVFGATAAALDQVLAERRRGLGAAQPEHTAEGANAQ